MLNAINVPLLSSLRSVFSNGLYLMLIGIARYPRRQVAMKAYPSDTGGYCTPEIIDGTAR